MAQYIILLPLIIQLAGLTFTVLTDFYISKKHKKIMALIIVLNFVLILQNCADYALNNFVQNPWLRTVIGIVGYSVRPAIIMLFCTLVCDSRKHFIGWILVALNALVYLTALFSKIAFYVNASNKFQRGPLNYTAHIISGVLLVYLIYSTFYEHRNRKSHLWIPIINVALVVCGTVLDMSPLYVDFPVSYLTIAVVSSSLFYYIWLHLEFVREHEKALMAEQRIKIMMSQIQPHFLFNTLSTIQALCRIDPKKAFETTEKFGTYLRNNIDSLNQPELIPLEKELEHTRIYAEIEMIRFPKITVEYQIEERMFSVPALSIQPLVENAIRHGVRPQGTVQVSTKATPTDYVICIRDNGAGFDDTQTKSDDNGVHIGIANVRERIKTMCGGILRVESRLNEGTTVTITIPKT